MGVYIPNMSKPLSCYECVKSLDIECCGDIRNCPLIEIGDLEYQAYKEFMAMLLEKIEERILYGERRE